MTKALGKDIIAFYLDESELYEGHEDCEIEFDDITELDPRCKYELKQFGSLLVPDSDRWVSFQSAFIKWQRKQTHESFVVTLPKEEIDKAKKILNQFFKGVKID